MVKEKSGRLREGWCDYVGKVLFACPLCGGRCEIRCGYVTHHPRVEQFFSGDVCQ